MSDSDSFISEVNEEVRRDRLYALFRRWWWAGALVVTGAVGGAAFVEYQRAQTEAAAQGFGDDIIAALDMSTPGARVSALEEITPASPEAEILLALFAASEASQSFDPAPAAARLRQAAETPEVPRRYRDLALLKAEMIAPSEPAQARLILAHLAQPGAPYEAIAAEQLALLDIAEGDLEAGLDGLRALERSAAATPGLQQRAAQLIVAFSAGATLVDTVPEPEQDAQPETAPATVGEPEVAPEANSDTTDGGADATAGSDVSPEADEAVVGDDAGTETD